MQILTRCQGDHCVINDGEGLTAVDFDGGDTATVGVIDRSKGQRDKRCGHKELATYGVGKVPLLIEADATVVVHKEDGLVQKNISVDILE
ncbi:hypothetical protein GW17_00016755 [Ensete ventricosum]|nr:hypothetical protein GW17_00016755 [Ensete ventricosum]RZS03040.1 hypothetical protein BHM03_00033163 [Ensete ventricosum]